MKFWQISFGTNYLGNGMLVSRLEGHSFALVHFGFIHNFSGTFKTKYLSALAKLKCFREVAFFLLVLLLLFL